MRDDSRTGTEGPGTGAGHTEIVEGSDNDQQSDRLAEHEGQNPLRLQENDNKNSFLQFGHRTRAKPFFRIPQSRYFSTTRAMTGRQAPQCFSKRRSYSPTKRSK